MNRPSELITEIKTDGGAHEETILVKARRRARLRRLDVDSFGIFSTSAATKFCRNGAATADI